jgi:FkbM family methyltransferase
MIKQKYRPNSLLRASFNHQPIKFRGTDSNALLEVFHEKEYQFLEPSLTNREAPVVLDVGAHIGTFAVWALNHAPDARILSIEPDPQTFAVLSENRSLNKGCWEIVNRAAADTDDASLRFSNDGPSMSHRISSNGTLVVQTISLRSILNRAAEHGPVDLLKVDIEGAEERFICADPSLLRHVRSLVIELHPGLCDTDRVRDVLSSNFRYIREITGRVSSKPLLYCEN